MAVETWGRGRIHHAAPMGGTSKYAGCNGVGCLVSFSKDSMETRAGKYGWRSKKLHPGWSSLRTQPSITRYSFLTLLQVVLLAVSVLIQPSLAVFIDYRNCLSPGVINSKPQNLQFVPKYVWATFNSSGSSRNINVTAYGNITGIATVQPYPAINDPQWKDPNATLGKIPDIGGTGNDTKYTTFTTQFNVLDYTPYDPPAVRFCNSSSLTQCPLAPVFNFTGNAYVKPLKSLSKKAMC